MNRFRKDLRCVDFFSRRKFVVPRPIANHGREMNDHSRFRRDFLTTMIRSRLIAVYLITATVARIRAYPRERLKSSVL